MRQEKRFIITNQNKNEIISLAKKLGESDSYCDSNDSYNIESHYRLIWKTEDQKGKIRLRKYTVNASCDYYIENKFKINGSNDKKRIAISEEQYKTILVFGTIKEIVEYIRHEFPEILFFIDDDSCEIEYDSIHLCYSRNAFHVIINDKKNRITIDSNIDIIHNGSKLSMFSENECIVEIKGNATEKLIETFQMDEIGRKRKNSKYRTAKKILKSNNSIQPLEEYIDALEHEMKFKLETDAHPQMVFEKMNQYFTLIEEGVDYVTDYYYDTKDLHLFNNHMSYRLRTREGSKRFRINYKFPAILEEQPMFTRREIISKLEKKSFNLDNPLSIQCTVNHNVCNILSNQGYNPEDQHILQPVLIIKTMRIRYWVAKKEKDIVAQDLLQKATRFSFFHNKTYKELLDPKLKNNARACSGYFGQGLVGFDFSLFYCPEKPMFIDSSQEFEFELWNGALCPELFNLYQLISKEIKDIGLSACLKSKYEDFLERLDINNYSEDKNCES